MKRSLAMGAVTLAVLGASASSARAAEPATRACLGTSFWALATGQDPGVFGAKAVGFAQDSTSRPGLGDGIQAVLAGLVPDHIVPNTCNDAP